MTKCPSPIAGMVWPARPLDDYLSELRAHGYTVLDGLIDEAALERIKTVTAQQVSQLEPSPPAFDDRFGVPHGIAWSEDVCNAVTHPAALWVLRAYLGTSNIRFCHQPAMTVLRPAKDLIGQFPEEGWHADYPYHPDVYPDDRWQDNAVYGVQFNLCIDAFRAGNGATQYVPDSHLLRRWPPRALNEGGTRIGIGPHDQVMQMEAPAGAALIYDSRTWHRACPELNVSGEDRLAILNAVCPAWIRSMVNKQSGTEHYRASNMAAQLEPLVRDEIETLCHTDRFQTPAGVPNIIEKQFVGQRKIQI